MILRRITDHIKAQNWTAVALDFVIVVLGVFIGLQVQDWSVERERKKNEHEYLLRLHDEVEQLLKTRAGYDRTRRDMADNLIAVLSVLDDPSGKAIISETQCDAIVASAYTTVPPAALPTITELLSTGRLDQLTSSPVRAAILSYLQDTARARDLIFAITESGRDLGKRYPHLIKHNVGPSRLHISDKFWLNPDCDIVAMRADPAFRNELSENAYNYNVYADRAVLPVSAQLAALHSVLDREMGVVHTAPESDAP